MNRMIPFHAPIEQASDAEILKIWALNNEALGHFSYSFYYYIVFYFSQIVYVDVSVA